MTTASAQTRARGNEALTEMPPMGRIIVSGLCLAVVVTAIMILIQSSIWAVIGVVVLIGLVDAMVGVVFWRRWVKRCLHPSHIAEITTQALRVQVPRDRIKATRFGFGSITTPGPPRAITINVLGLGSIDPLGPSQLVAALAKNEGMDYRLNSKKSKKGRKIVIREAKKERRKDIERREEAEKNEAQERFSQAAKTVLGPKANVEFHWAVDDTRPESTEYLESVDITEIADSMELALSGKRNQIATRLRSQLPGDTGDYRFAAIPNQDRVQLFKPTPLPTVVMPPRDHPETLRSHEDYTRFAVPLGMAANSVVCTWCPRRDAHMLITGLTGSGKTIALHGLVQHLAQAAWRVWLADGKGFEFSGYREFPNIEYLAQKAEAIVRLLKLAYDTMWNRYELIRERKVHPSQFDPICLVIDELTEVYKQTDLLWEATKGKAKGSNPAREWIGSLMRLARSAKIHLVVGMQRPDAAIFGDGEVRSNFGGRMSCGRMSDVAGSRMMWNDDPAIGLQVAPVKGRGVGMVGGVPTQVQATYSANPDTWHADDYRPGMVRAAWPRTEVYTRKTIADPTPAEEEQPLAWPDLEQAKMLDANGDEIIFDPVASEESRRMRQTRRAETSAPSPDDLIPQPAQSLDQGLTFFPDPDPVDDLEFGASTVTKIRHLIGNTSRPKSARAVSLLDAQSLPDTSTAVSTGPTETRTADKVEEATYVVDDNDGTEFMVSTVVASDDAQMTTFFGYTADGAEHTMAVPTDAEVRTRKFQSSSS